MLLCSRLLVSGMVMLAVLFFPSQLVQSRIGINYDSMLSTDDWNILLGPSSSIPQITKDSFAIIHAYFYNNTLNQNAIKNIGNAWSSGIRDISIYVYPCISSSVYSQSSDLKCGTASDQLQTIIDTFAEYEIEFEKHPSISPTSSTPTTLMSSIPTSSPSLYVPVSATVQRIFINLEDESPNRYFSADHYRNVQFLAEYVDHAVESGIQVGVFTTRQDWLGIMVDKVSNSPRSLSTRTDFHRYPTSNVSYVDYNPFYKLPLWLPKYDQQNNMNFFVSFEGWTTVLMKQIKGGSSQSRRIGSSRLGVDYISDVPTLSPGQYDIYSGQVLEFDTYS